MISITYKWFRGNKKGVDDTTKGNKKSLAQGRIKILYELLEYPYLS